VGPGFAGCKATGAAEVLGGWGAAAMGSGLALGSVRAPTGGGSRDGVDVGVGGLRQAGDGAPEDDLAVASPAPSGGDATNAPGQQGCKRKQKMKSNAR
jgi:hypothetical protein